MAPGFCCTDCTWVHDCLINICALGAIPVPAPFLDSIVAYAAENNRLNLCWQVLRGRNTEDQTLLSQSLKLIKVNYFVCDTTTVSQEATYTAVFAKGTQVCCSIHPIVLGAMLSEDECPLPI